MRGDFRGRALALAEPLHRLQQWLVPLQEAPRLELGEREVLEHRQRDAVQQLRRWLGRRGLVEVGRVGRPGSVQGPDRCADGVGQLVVERLVDHELRAAARSAQVFEDDEAGLLVAAKKPWVMERARGKLLSEPLEGEQPPHPRARVVTVAEQPLNKNLPTATGRAGPNVVAPNRSLHGVAVERAHAKRDEERIDLRVTIEIDWFERRPSSRLFRDRLHSCLAVILKMACHKRPVRRAPSIHSKTWQLLRCPAV